MKTVRSKAPLGGSCQNGDPNATQRSGCVWERRSEVAREQSRYTVRDCGRYAVRDDEGDCNLHIQFCLRGGQRTADHNPSVTSLRTCHLPLHRGGFSVCGRDGGRELAPDGNFYGMVSKPGGAGGPRIEKRFYSVFCMNPAGGSCNPRKMDLIFAQGGA